MEAVEAATQSVGSGTGTQLIGLLAIGGRALRVLIKTPSSGIYVGGSGVSSSQGFPLNAGQEYEFILRPTPGQSNADENALNVFNSSGSSVNVSWIATAAD